MKPTATDRPEQELRVRLSEDRMTADLEVPAGYPRESLTHEACAAAFAEKGVILRPAMHRSIDEQIARIVAQDPPVDAVVRLEGTAAEDGVDGRLELDRRFDPGCAAPTHDADDDRVDYYAQSSFINVRAGDVIGRLEHPTRGSEGFDLTGAVRKPRTGKPAPVRVHPTVSVEEDGSCVAQASGVLSVADRVLKVLEMLPISGDVDFSTGHIDVECDVEVTGLVKDRFTVRTGRNVRVRGLIEGATIRCGGSLFAMGGMAGKLKGRVETGEDLAARYLNNVSARVGRDLIVEREIVNCVMDVGGELRMKGGAFVGATAYVRRAVHVGVLGSDGGERAVMGLGSHGPIERVIAATEHVLEQYAAELEPIEREIELLRRVGGMRTSERRQIGELEARRAVTGERCDRIAAKLATLREKFEGMRELSMTVERVLHPGVVVVANGSGYRFAYAVKGPLRIDRDEGGVLVLRDLARGGSMPLEKVSVKIDPPARDRTPGAASASGEAA